MLLIMIFSLPIAYTQEPAYNKEMAREASIKEWTDVEAAISYWDKEYESEKSQDDPKYKADVCLILSKAYTARREVESMELWNDRASDIYDRLGDTRGQAEVLYQKGFTSYCNREYEKAMEYVLRGIGMMEELNDEEGIGLGYLRMTRLFHFTMKLPESAEYGEKGGEILEKLGDDLNAADAWSFAGHGYRMSLDSANASRAFNRTLELAEKSKIPAVLSMAYNDLATFNMEYDIYDEAEKYFMKSLELADTSNQRQIMVIKNGLSQVYLHTDRFEDCIKISKEAMATVLKTNDIFFLSELPEYIARSYEGLMQYDSAYKYMKLNWQYSDSLFTANQDEALQEMETRYESELKQKTIERQQREQLFGIALLLSFVGIILLLYKRYRTKNELNNVLEDSNKEKDFLIKEIHHRVKNNLQILSSLLSLQSDNEEDEKVLGALREGQNRVESMGMIHQRLYTKESVSAIHMNDYILDLCDYLSDSSISSDQNIEILSEVAVDMIDIETAIPLGLIINELVTNSLKYAFPSQKDGEVRVKLWQDNEGLLCLHVYDNGVGKVRPNNEVNSTGFGTKLIAILSKKLKGTSKIDTTDGYSTTIRFERFKLVA